MTPEHDTSAKYRDAPPFSLAILLQKHAPSLAGSSTFTAIYITMWLPCVATPSQKHKYEGQVPLEHPQSMFGLLEANPQKLPFPEISELLDPLTPK